MADNKVRVIFRRDYDPYMKIEKYLACFPDDQANLGNIAFVPIYMNGDMKCHDCYDEMPYEYFLSKQIVHKNDPIVNELVDILKYFYGDEYKVMEKWRKRRIEDEVIQAFQS